MTRLAFTMTSRVVWSLPLTPPLVSLERHVPLTPVATFLPLMFSKRTLSAAKPSMKRAPALSASGRKEITGPCFSAAPHPSVQ